MYSIRTYLDYDQDQCLFATFKTITIFLWICDRVFEMAVEVEKKAVDLGLLEEDDIFEEFPAESKLLFRSNSKVHYTKFIYFLFSKFKAITFHARSSFFSFRLFIVLL